MKRNFVVGVFGGVIGTAVVLMLLSAAGIVGAALYTADRVNGAEVRSARSVSRANEVSAATPLTLTFTYQGQLKNGGTAVNGSCQMAFRLYDDPSASTNLIGSPITTTVPVTNGLFTVGLNFGSNAFDGNGRWLDVQVNCTGTFVPLPRQAITPAPYALFASNANLLDGQDSNAFVTLSGAQTISGIKTFLGGVKFSDGTTQTTAFYRPALPGPGAAATADSAGIVGEYTSITIGADGLGLISYYDNTNDDLKILHCGNAACSSGNTATTVDSAFFVGTDTSITIGADGLGLISYYDSTNGDLKVLHCGNVACNSGNTATTVDSAGFVGDYTAITIGADGLGLISYSDAGNVNLKVLHCGNAACNSGNISTTVDSAGDVGRYTSITIGADGLGLISYLDLANGDLKVLHCGNAACNSGNLSTTVDSAGFVGQFTSITIGADGLGLIGYSDAGNGDLKVLHCGNAACNSGNLSTTVDSASFVGQFTSITVGADGLGLISYYDAFPNQDLKVLHCGNAACSSGNISTTVDSAGDVGSNTSVTIGADGNFGPYLVFSGEHYELSLERAGFPTGHYYFQPWPRSTNLVRMNASAPGSLTLANTNASENHSAIIVQRQKEWWVSHPSGQNDSLKILTLSRSGGFNPPVEVLTPITSNGIIAIHVHDDVATPLFSSLALLPFFPTQAFQSGVDVFMPADSPPDGTIGPPSAGETARAIHSR